MLRHHLPDYRPCPRHLRPRSRVRLHPLLAGMKTRGYSVKFTGENRA